MNGIHDMGGMHGFGRVEVEEKEPLFHARWEGRVRAMVLQMLFGGWTNIDAFRHAIERVDPAIYLTVGYYGRWLRALETLLVEACVLSPGELAARVAGRALPTSGTIPSPPHRGGRLDVTRCIDAPAQFRVGQAVRARNLHPAGHTRLPRYTRGKRGVVQHIRSAFVFPDTNAHGLGEKPQYVYSVRFPARELWGEDAEARATVCIDLFEDYLEPI